MNKNQLKHQDRLKLRLGRLLPVCLLLSGIHSYAQYTQSENYVASKTYLEPVTTSSTTAKQIQSVTYFDGLGRPKQVVNVKATPKGNDLVTIIPYDRFGRQVDSYLPVSMISAKGGIQSLDSLGVVSYYTTPQNTTTKDFPIVDTNPFSHKVLENSPLDRIQQQIQPGNAWSNKPVTFGYDASKSTDKVMRFWSNVYWPNQNNNDLRLETAKYFGDNQLYKNTVTDEDGNVSIEFKNGEGQTLLVRKMLTPTQPADTYYVYDEYNRLSFVISPEASQKLDAALAGGSSALDPATRDIIDNLCYRYKYDGRNRLIEKKIPGKGWEYMVYDKQDRLIFTQDANLASANNAFGAKGWLFTKYDQFGRVVYTGFVASTDGRAAVQNIVDTSTTIISNNESRSGTAQNYNGINLYYTNNAFPSVITKLLSVNYYDTYPPDLASVPASIQSQAVLPQTGNQSTKSLPTASFVKNLENDKWTKTYTFYDQKARPVGTWSYNHLGGYTKNESVLDFAGVPQKTMTYHKRLSSSTETVIKEDFVYDHQNRLLEHYHEVVGKSPVVSLAKNTYNEIGQLVKKEVGRSAIMPLQTVYYTYNIRGWMTGINSGDIAYNAADESYVLNDGKLFGYNIRYNNPENPSLGAAKYNGNISEIDWISKDVPMKRYGYQYDNLNRLLRGNYQDPGTTLPESHLNDEVISYDLNGNIKTLDRFTKGKSTANQIDGLVYSYDNSNSSNRLISIVDTKNNISGYEGGGNLIEYDANGNMTKMMDKKISAIAYNFLNLPKQINQNANVTNYFYRADGVKVKKKFVLTNSAGTKVINTEYLDGFQYSTPNTDPLRKALEEPDDVTMEVARAGEEEAFSKDETRKIAVVDPGIPELDNMILSFFPTAEGYYDFENLRYIYQYKDHLGNVRVSYVKNSAGDLQIMDRNDYYPFGMSFLKPFGQVSLYDPMTIPYNYKYNGKELQETGMYDYGARFYMPDIGRWGVIDPLADVRPDMSPFRYSFNNPVNATDPTGLLEDWVGTTDATGSTTWEWKSEITSEAQATAAGYDSYSDGKSNNVYTSNRGTEVTLGENGNWTENGLVQPIPMVAPKGEAFDFSKIQLDNSNIPTIGRPSPFQGKSTFDILMVDTNPIMPAIASAVAPPLGFLSGTAQTINDASEGNYFGAAIGVISLGASAKMSGSANQWFRGADNQFSLTPGNTFSKTLNQGTVGYKWGASPMHLNKIPNPGMQKINQMLRRTSLPVADKLGLKEAGHYHLNTK